MDNSSADQSNPQLSVQLDFISSMLSWINGSETSIPNRSQEIRKVIDTDCPGQKYELTFDEMNLNSKNAETEVCQKQEYIQQIQHQSFNLSTKRPQILGNQAKKQRKDQIKTFPNFIFRNFSHYLRNYEHFYSENDGLPKLKKYLKSHQGAKHYTLQELICLFKDNSFWNSKLNRTVLHKILQRYSYQDIFCNSQRKKKKTYLIMTKVFKLRSRNSHLSTRVQAQ